MNILDRIILGLYSFCLAIVSAVVILIGTNVIDYSLVTYWVNVVYTNSQYMTIAMVIAAIFFLISLKFLLSGPKKSKMKAAIKKKSELGNIMISLNSIQNIVTTSIKEIYGVVEQKIHVSNHKDTVKLKLKVVVTPEQSIPDLSTRIQNTAKQVIENIAGVEVSYIEVYIDNVVKASKQKSKSNEKKSQDTEQKSEIIEEVQVES